MRDNREDRARAASPSGDVPPAAYPVSVPVEYAFEKFRHSQGWTDDKVIGRQPIWRVEFLYKVQQLEVEYGAI